MFVELWSLVHLRGPALKPDAPSRVVVTVAVGVLLAVALGAAVYGGVQVAEMMAPSNAVSLSTFWR